MFHSTLSHWVSWAGNAFNSRQSERWTLNNVQHMRGKYSKSFLRSLALSKISFVFSPSQFILIDIDEIYDIFSFLPNLFSHMQKTINYWHTIETMSSNFDQADERRVETRRSCSCVFWCFRHYDNASTQHGSSSLQSRKMELHVSHCELIKWNSTNDRLCRSYRISINDTPTMKHRRSNFKLNSFCKLSGWN